MRWESWEKEVGGTEWRSQVHRAEEQEVGRAQNIGEFTLNVALDLTVLLEPDDVFC